MPLGQIYPNTCHNLRKTTRIKNHNKDAFNGMENL